MRAGRWTASLAEIAPPFDCMMRSRPGSSDRASRSRYGAITGTTYASATVVDVRSYSRITGSTSDESEIGSPSGDSAAATARSCAGLAYACNKQIAIDLTSSARSRCTSSASAAWLGAVSTLPSGASRSSIPRRCVASKSGGVTTGCSAYSDGRACRPSSSTSSKPAVVTSAVGPPRRSSSALVATVVECTTSETAAPSAAACTPASTASAGSRGVESRLTTRRLPSRNSATTSVNVPPVSTPILTRGY